MANFGLNPSDGADAMMRGNGVAAFLDALQARVDREEKEKEKEKEGEEGGGVAGAAGGEGDGASA